MEAGQVVRCNWATSFQLCYRLAECLRSLCVEAGYGKTGSAVLFRSSSRMIGRTDLLFQASVQTYEAYNAWGGESLYRDASGTLPNGYALKSASIGPSTTTAVWDRC